MNENQIQFQSAFCSLHNTETTLVKVSNDLLLAADSSLYSILILLDLSVAFDTVGHNVLISCLKHSIVVALDWFISNLSNRSFWSGSGMPPPPVLPSLVVCPRGPLWVPSFSQFTCYPWDISCAASISIFTVVLTTPNSIYHLNLETWRCFPHSFLPNWSQKLDVKKFLQLNDKLEVVIITPTGPSTSYIKYLSSSLGAVEKCLLRGPQTWVSFLIHNYLSMHRWPRLYNPALHTWDK